MLPDADTSRLIGSFEGSSSTQELSYIGKGGSTDEGTSPRKTKVLKADGATVGVPERHYVGDELWPRITPYAPREVAKLAKRGLEAAQAASLPSGLYELLTDCFARDLDVRPTTSELLNYSWLVAAREAEQPS